MPAGIDGNKVILVNVLVEYERPYFKTEVFQPSWWDSAGTGKAKIRLISEIQITVGNMYYLDKQFHAAYLLYWFVAWLVCWRDWFLFYFDLTKVMKLVDAKLP